MPQPLIILGIGGNALDVLDVVDALNAAAPAWTVLGFLDDAHGPGTLCQGLKVLGGIRDAGRFPEAMFLNAIGSDRSYRRRPDILAMTFVPAERFATLVHPAACVSSRARIGPGTCVNARVCVAGEVTIGSHVWLGTGCVIGHDTIIEDFAVIGPGAIVSGFVRVSASAYIGAGAMIRQKIHISDEALVGIGAVVIRDVPPNGTVVGNPARPMRHRTESG